MANEQGPQGEDGDPIHINDNLLPNIVKSMLIVALLSLAIVSLAGCRSLADAQQDERARDNARFNLMLTLDHEDRIKVLEKKVEMFEKGLTPAAR